MVLILMNTVQQLHFNQPKSNGQAVMLMPIIIILANNVFRTLRIKTKTSPNRIIFKLNYIVPKYCFNVGFENLSSNVANYLIGSN